MSKVYILSTYEEHGAENVMATAEPGRLATMIRDYYDGLPTMDGPTGKIQRENMNQTRDEALVELANYMADEPDEQTSGHNLQLGWGGMQLHIVRLT